MPLDAAVYHLSLREAAQLALMTTASIGKVRGMKAAADRESSLPLRASGSSVDDGDSLI
jgi:hypothetical protein